MAEQTVTLRNETGLHARPAKVFANAAGDVDGDVRIEKNGKEVNAESVLAVLSLDCHQGDEIVIRVDGDDAESSLETLVDLVESGLGEDE